MPEYITRQELLLLSDKINEKFAQECQKDGVEMPTTLEAYYGYNKFDGEGIPSIKNFITRYPAVSGYLDKINAGVDINKTGYKKINGKDLYDRLRKMKKEAHLEGVSLDDIYQYVYFKYIDCKDINEFRQKFMDALKVQEEIIRYKAFYYSFMRHQIRYFELEVSLLGNGEIKAAQKGFFDAKPNAILDGKGQLTRYNLHLSLESEEDDLMDIYIHINQKKPESSDILVGMMVTQSSYHFPVSVELLLIREDVTMDESDERQVERYLYLKRHHRRAFDREYASLQDLMVRGVLVNSISFLAGKTYRVWNFFGTNHIEQSKLIIETNYHSKRFTTKELYERNEQTQTCLLSIEDAVNHRLFITLHPAQGSGVLGSFILDVPNRQRSELVTGVYTSVGLRNEPSTNSGVVLLNDNSEFYPGLISLDQLGNVQGLEPEKLTKLKNALGI